MDGMVMATVRALFDKRREQSDAHMASRREHIYAQIPEIEQIEASLRVCALDAAMATLSAPDPGAAIRAIGKRSLDLQAKRAELLVERGYSYDYLTQTYRCKKCGDTGFIGSTPCECFLAECKAEQIRQLSSLLDVAGASFETFRLDYYSDVKDARYDVSPRKNMASNLQICRDFAERFGEKTDSLILYGGPGLGKTFLSACIASSVIEKGHSVAYETAYNLFLNLENERFNRASDDVKAVIRRYFTCDLLILDDLGTEMVSALSTAALYNLLNTRAAQKLPIVITSNIHIDALTERYSTQIHSRLAGEFIPLFFFGEDIRSRKKRG